MTIGEYLKRIREEKKITLEQVAEGTKIRIQFLKAIEEDRLNDLPSLSQAKGFCRLYASFLGLNPVQVFDDVEKANRPVEKPEPVVESAEKQPAPVAVENHEARPKKNITRVTRRKQEVAKPGQEPSVPVEEKPHSQIIFEEIGKELQKQREALGLSRIDIERQIKIREYFIYSLEHGQIDNLPSTVQGRGMLNNYAAFMNLDADSMQMRYAEGLQLRRQERHQAEEEARKTGITVVGKEPLSGWRKFLTTDLLVGGSVFIILFSLVIWGAIQVIRTSFPDVEPAASQTVALLPDATPSPSAVIEVTESPVASQNVLTQTGSAPGTDLQTALTAVSSDPIQLVVVAYQRAYMKITVDGKEEFSGRVTPGNVYSYSGKTKITLLTGNGAALQVYYNQQDQGIIGFLGEVVELEFTAKAMVTPTPRFTATPTRTQQPTLTALPTQTLQPTATIPTITITPARTITPQP
ncbi:MAG: DUF4115 domain-containing protein [Anaerolineaceae bacterium]|nr:DUF4115 domain-containing protein [Anaerolineaceae bacterium]